MTHARVLPVERWHVHVYFDTAEVAEKSDPELYQGEARLFCEYIKSQWDPDSFEECVVREDTKVSFSAQSLDQVSLLMDWLIMRSVPQRVELIRNGER